jgi:predicted nucleotidyltransferase
MNILPIKREGNGYHDSTISKETLASATAIREIMEKSLFATKDYYGESSLPSELQNHMPKSVYSIICDKKNEYVRQNDFSSLLQYKLLTEGNSDLGRYADVSMDLSDKIHKNIRHYQTYDNFCELLKSKELTYSRINRALTHILLNITQEMYENAKLNDYAGYARILGFRKEATPLLSEIGKKTTIPLISKLADASKILSDRELHYLEHDIFCSHVYESIVALRKGATLKNEFQREIIRL